MPYRIPVWFFSFAVVLCLASGCAHRQPEIVSGVVGTVPNPDFPIAWDRALNVLYFKGYTVKTADRNTGMVVTEKKVMLLGESQAECPEFRRVPYIENKRAIKYASVTIKIGKGDKTTVTVTTEIDGSPDGSKTETGERLSCVSRGVLEKELIMAILPRMEPR